MGSPLLDFLINSTFVSRGKPSTNVIAHAPLTHILDFCFETVELTKAVELARETSVFTHSASFPLAGGRFPCNALDCRLERVNELAQFAALYTTWP